MMSENETEDAPVARPMADVPQMLQTRLVEEAHVRAARRETLAALENQRAAVARIAGKGALGGWLRKVSKKPEAPEVLAAREEENRLRAADRRVEEIARRLAGEVEALADVHVAGTLAEYTGYRDARKRLQPWEQAVAQFQAKLGQLVETLGQARNMASSGYDRKRKALSGTAKSLLDRAVDQTKTVVKLVETANEAARTLGDMPEINFDYRPSQIADLEKMDIAAMQAEFDRIKERVEAIQKNEVEVTKANGVGEAEIKRQQADTYLAQYLQEIRQHTDAHHLVPDQVSYTVERLAARYSLR